jgi:hypothetical protein
MNRFYCLFIKKYKLFNLKNLNMKNSGFQVNKNDQKSITNNTGQRPEKVYRDLRNDTDEA